LRRAEARRNCLEQSHRDARVLDQERTKVDRLWSGSWSSIRRAGTSRMGGA